MPLNIAGLATGLDTNTLIDQLLAIEKRPINLLETRKLKFQALSTAFQDLNKKLLALKTKADGLKDPATFFPRSVTSSTDSVATATAEPGADQGVYTLTATQLARNSIATASNTTDALTDTVATGSGNFTFKLGASGAEVTVAVTSTTTLNDLVTAINAKNAGVKATAVNVGTVQTPAYQLTLTSTATGAANNIVIVTDPTTLSVANSQTGLDAAFSITGIGSFTRAANTFSDVIDGVTITLKAGSGSADLSLSYDKSGLQSRLQGLVDAYNDVVRAIDSQTTGTKSSDGKVTAGAFSGDPIPRQLRLTLASKIATQLTGTYKSLAELGITTGKDGTLSLDNSKFQKALTGNPKAVSDLVAGTSTKDGIADLLSGALDAATKSVTGTIAARVDGIDTSIRNLQKQIDSGLARIEIVERSMRKKFKDLETTIARLQSTGNSLRSQLAQLQALATAKQQ